MINIQYIMHTNTMQNFFTYIHMSCRRHRCEIIDLWHLSGIWLICRYFQFWVGVQRKKYALSHQSTRSYKYPQGFTLHTQTDMAVRIVWNGQFKHWDWNPRTLIKTDTLSSRHETRSDERGHILTSLSSAVCLLARLNVFISQPTLWHASFFIVPLSLIHSPTTFIVHFLSVFLLVCMAFSDFSVFYCQCYFLWRAINQKFCIVKLKAVRNVFSFLCNGLGQLWCLSMFV